MVYVSCPRPSRSHIGNKVVGVLNVRLGLSSDADSKNSLWECEDVCIAVALKQDGRQGGSAVMTSSLRANNAPQMIYLVSGVCMCRVHRARYTMCIL